MIFHRGFGDSPPRHTHVNPHTTWQTHRYISAAVLPVGAGDKHHCEMCSAVLSAFGPRSYCS